MRRLRIAQNEAKRCAAEPGSGRRRPSWLHPWPWLRDAARQGDVDLGVVGGHVDAALAQDQADLGERDATAQHLGRCRVAQQMGALDGSLHAGTLQGTCLTTDETPSPQAKGVMGARMRRNTRSESPPLVLQQLAWNAPDSMDSFLLAPNRFLSWPSQRRHTCRGKKTQENHDNSPLEQCVQTMDPLNSVNRPGQGSTGR
jgi:hypothetical protein